MAGTQVIDAKRAPSAFEIEPEKLTVERNPRGTYYDPRIELPVTEEHIATWPIAGQTKDIVVWKDGDKIRVVDGLQTWKTAIAINERRVDSGLPPILVRVEPKKFTDGAAMLMARSVSNLRHRSTTSMRAFEAFSLKKQGVPDDNIKLVVGFDTDSELNAHLDLAVLHKAAKEAVDAGQVTLTNAVKWLKKVAIDDQPAALVERMKAPAPKRKDPAVATKTGRPSAAAVRAAAKHTFAPDALSGDIPLQVARTTIRWAAGEATTEELLAVVPSLKPAFSAKKATSSESATAE